MTASSFELHACESRTVTEDLDLCLITNFHKFSLYLIKMVWLHTELKKKKKLLSWFISYAERQPNFQHKETNMTWKTEKLF